MRNVFHACKGCTLAGECLLSEREKEVLSWCSKGKTAEETGTILGISRRTVEFHINSARRKSSAANVVHVIAQAVRCGVIGLMGSGICGVGIAYALQSPTLRKFMLNSDAFEVVRTLIS
jgi:DNA-binding CsgD family transcriptional regulator